MSANFTLRKHPDGWMARRIVDPIILGPIERTYLEALMKLSDDTAPMRERFRAALAGIPGLQHREKPCGRLRRLAAKKADQEYEARQQKFWDEAV